jgi:hypothetical protein
MGEPPIPHDGATSNVAAFVLRPTLVVDNATANDITLTITPIVGQNQRVVLLLNRLDAGEPRAYRFPGPERNADAAQLVIPIQNVQAGRYVVRVQIDGAESLLTVDENPASPTYRQFIGPIVVIP